MPARTTEITKDGLSLKEQKFIQAYLETGDGAESVRRAGYQLGSKNGSKTPEDANNTAAVIAYENLRKPHIKQAIAKGLVKQNITPETILMRINNIADTSEQDRDRLRALELLGKAYKMFTDNQDNKDINITLTLGKFNGLQIDGEVVEGEIINK